MSNDLVSVFLLSLVAVLNPTLLAAVTVVLRMPNPKRLMLGYLLGAYAMSITFGLVIVFTLDGAWMARSGRSAAVIVLGWLLCG